MSAVVTHTGDEDLQLPGAPPPRRLLVGYVVALASLGAFVLARALLRPVLGDTPAVVLFLVPVGIAAWFGGFGPGMVTTILGCVIGLKFFVQRPGATIADAGPLQYWLTRAVPYTLVGTFISFLSAHLEQARQTAEREKVAAQHAREVAEAASRLKDDFLATISHELRTPLSAIVGWASLLQQQRDGGQSDDDMLREGLEVIRRNARAQSQLIEDILDVARITSGNVRLDGRRVDLREPIEAALATVQTAAAAKGVNLQADLGVGGTPPFISGDPDRLQQVFWNLLSNAIKFTSPGGHVRLSIDVDEAHATISVTDDGPGMDAAFVPHVFDRFRQADMSTTRRQGGLGLGLAIVRQLVELHGGEVAASSPGLGKGSRFDVVLPILSLPIASGALPAEATPTNADERSNKIQRVLRGSRVLVVDDDPDARRVIEATLMQGGTRVTSVDSVDAALNMLVTTASEPFSAIVSDIGMPGSDGYAFIRQVRNGESARGNPRVPALALTAYTREVDRAQTLAAGFDGFLAKPAEPDVLLRMVAAMVEGTAA